MILVHTRSQRWFQWIPLLPALWILATAFAEPGDGMRRMLLSTVHILFVPYVLYWMASSQEVLTGPVLVTHRNSAITHIPLAVGEIQVRKKSWDLRWPAGRTMQKLSFYTPLAFREEVERAATMARERESTTVPMTEKEAGQAIPVARAIRPWSPQVVAAIAGLLLLALAYWWQVPLLLLPALPLFLLADRYGPQERLLLLFDHLYIVERSGETRVSPLATIGALEPAGPQRYRLQLSGERDILIPADFAKALQARMAGRPILFDRKPSTGDGAVQPGPLRCTLCGRPEPSGLTGAGIFICETCSMRARHEAEKGGHGLGGQEPKPI